MLNFIAQITAFILWKQLREINFNIPKKDAIKLYKKSVWNNFLFKFFKIKY